MRPFNQFRRQNYVDQTKINDAEDWWSAVPLLLSNMGKIVNRVKPRLNNDELNDLRNLYRTIRDEKETNKNEKKYDGIGKEKENMKQVLRTLNEAASRTGMYIGIVVSRPNPRYPVSYGGRWVKTYKFTYGNDKAFETYIF